MELEGEQLRKGCCRLCIGLSELDSKHEERWIVCNVIHKCCAAEFKGGASKILVYSGATLKQLILAEYEEGDRVGEQFEEVRCSETWGWFQDLGSGCFRKRT